VVFRLQGGEHHTLVPTGLQAAATAGKRGL
jgi:hypothetical protein